MGEDFPRALFELAGDVPRGTFLPLTNVPGVFLFYRWLSYVLLLLLDLIVCLFILLGLAKQARWLLIL